MLFENQLFLRDRIANTDNGPIARSAFKSMAAVETDDPAAQLMAWGIAFRIACLKHNLSARELLEQIERRIYVGHRDGNEHILALEHYCKIDLGPSTDYGWDAIDGLEL